MSLSEEIQLSRSRDCGRDCNSVTLITFGFVAAEFKSHKSFVESNMTNVRLDFIHMQRCNFRAALPFGFAIV